MGDRLRDKDAIFAALRRLEPGLKRRYPLRQIGSFASYARGEQRPDSDLDIIIDVDLAPGLTLIDLARLEGELSESLGLPVEVAIKDALKPRIEKRILVFCPANID